MLTSVRFGRYKSLVDATLPLSTLTVLVGANASGKSNAIEALQLLHWLASGQRLSDLRVAMVDRELGIRGTPRSLFPRDEVEELVELGCDASVILAGEVDAHTLRYGILLGYESDELHVRREELVDEMAPGSLPLFQVRSSPEPGSGDLLVEYNNFSKGNVKPQIRCVDQQSVLTQLTTPARFRAGHRSAQRLIPAASTALRADLDAMLFLDPQPQAMRGYSFETDRKLRGDGSNLSSVLYDLVAQGEGDATLDFVRSLPEQDITRLGFLRAPRGEVMIELIETFGGRERAFDAGLLSDGTLRVLAVAAALLSVPEGSLVVIEELDNGVHPSRAARLLERILAVAERRRLRVLLTTHNPAMLDSLPDPVLPDVVACYRDPVSGASRLRRLADLEDYLTLVASGPLGQVVTRGVLERVLRHQRTEEEAIADALRLLDRRASA